MITPAISVLSAVEGLEIATSVFKPYVVPIAAGILLGLFAIQSHGSGKMGALFGPVMAVWFSILALAGLARVISRPAYSRHSTRGTRWPMSATPMAGSRSPCLARCSWL